MDTSTDADGYSRDGFASHGWKYGRESYLKLRYGEMESLQTRIQIKSTPHTRTIDAIKMELGRWYNRPVTLTRADISRLLSADTKRNRSDYDSYQLVAERRSIDSKPWDSGAQYEIPANLDAEYQDDE